MKKPVEIGPRAVPACLPTSKHGGDFLAGKILTTSGWGRTGNETHDMSKLRFVKLPGITNAECQKLYSADPEYIRTILPVELCAGDINSGGIDACQGDGGGNIWNSNQGIQVFILLGSQSDCSMLSRFIDSLSFEFRTFNLR